MEKKQLKELLLQSLEHERGGINVYTTAIKCAVDEQLRDKWKKYLAETREHEKILTTVCAVAGIKPETETAGRLVVRHLGEALVNAMTEAMEAGEPVAAELVACECVVIAETKDHLNWQLIGKCADDADGKIGAALREAYDRVEDQEDEHLYHTKGWCRELWVKSLGLAAVLPPVEEVQKVKTAIGAARAEQAAEAERASIGHV